MRAGSCATGNERRKENSLREADAAAILVPVARVEAGSYLKMGARRHQKASQDG